MDKALLEKALKIPPNKRVIFAELLLASIDKEDDGLREEWIGEVKNRMDAVRKGNAKLLDFEGLIDEMSYTTSLAVILLKKAQHIQ
jgi:hypothetical protein